jgi:RHS repeat-associated protein
MELSGASSSTDRSGEGDASVPVGRRLTGRTVSLRGLELVAIALVALAPALMPASAAAPTSLPTTISSDMTLTQAGSPYTGTSVTINSGVTVTAQPGVKVQLSGTLTVNGTLNAQGTATDPVVFTSTQDSAAGQWRGIALNSGAGASALDHVEVRYAGYNLTQAISVLGSSPSITNSIIRNNSARGIFVGSGSPEIAHNTVVDNGSYGIYDNTTQIKVHDNDVERNGGAGIYAYGSGGSLGGNTVRNNGGYGIQYSPPSNTSIVPSDIANNTLTGNGYSNALKLSGTLSQSTSWQDGGTPLAIGIGSLTISSGTTLTLGPGVVVKGAAGQTVGLVVDGTLDAEGTAEQPVTFTSIKDDTAGGDTNGDGANSSPAGGDWRGISYSANSGGGTLDHARISYGSWTYYSKPMIEINCPCSSPPTIRHSEISYSGRAGVGVLGTPGGSGPIVAWSHFHGNTYGMTYGGTGTLAAPNNDWGCPSGPRPYGCGDSVSSRTDPTPWNGSRNPSGDCHGQHHHCGEGADPVSLAVGDLTYSHTDLALTGRGDPLVFARSYNSGDTSDSGLGPGWSHTGLITASEEESGDVTITRADGRQDTFTQTQSGYSPPPGITDALVKNGDGTYKLTTLDRAVYQFNASGRIATITDDHGLATTYNYDSNGRLASISDASGQSLAFTYNSSNHITKVTDSAGRYVSYAYSSAGNLQTVTDALGGTTTYAYDSAHRLTSITDPRGVTFLRNTYDAQGRVTEQRDGLDNLWDLDYTSGQTTVTEPEGGTRTYSFDSQDRLVSETDELGHTTTYGYDAAGNLNDIVRPGGAAWQLNYNSGGNPTSITDPLGDQQSYGYDGQNRLTSYTDPRNKTFSYTWSPANDVTQLTDPQNHTTTLAYNSAGQPTAVTDPSDHTTSYGYDSRGNLTSLTDPLGHATAYGYDAYNNLTSVTRPGLAAETLERNKLGDLLSVTTPAGNKTSYTYDANGEPTQITDPALNTWQIVRDAMERPIQVTDPLGNQTQIAYDGDLNTTQVTDRRGNITTYGYDQANQLTEVERPAGDSYSFAYDERGNRTQASDPLGHTTTYAYDLADRLTQVEEPLGTTTHYGYDAAGNLTSLTDPRGNETDFAYDPLGRLTEIDQPLVKQASFAYDPAGNLASRTTDAGNLAYTHDAADRLTQVASGQDVLRTFAYDAADRLTQATDAQGKAIAISYNGEDLPTSIDDGRGQTVTRSYDSRGNLVSQVDGRGTTTYAYNALGLITGLTDPQGTAQTFAYNPEGSLTESDLGSGAVTTDSYDADGRLTRTATQAGQNTLQSFDYAYDADGRAISQIDEQGQQTTYGYDALGRLASFNPPDQPATTYSYDAAGNRTQAGSTTYDYNALNQLTHSSDGADYTYDGAGRLTQTTNGNNATAYSWDPLDELSRVEDGQGTTSYTYDALGRRSERTDANGTETAHYGDLSDLPILDTGFEGGILRSYVQGPGIQSQTALLEQRADGATTYPLANAHGDVTAVLDATGQINSMERYDPWGAELSGPSLQMGYLGAFERPTDPSTGLVQMGVRPYNPELGRFVTEDRLGGATWSGQSLDRYGYVGEDPMNRYDLNGLSPCILGFIACNEDDDPCASVLSGPMLPLCLVPQDAENDVVNTSAGIGDGITSNPFSSLGLGPNFSLTRSLRDDVLNKPGNVDYDSELYRLGTIAGDAGRFGLGATYRWYRFRPRPNEFPVEQPPRDVDPTP